MKHNTVTVTTDFGDSFAIAQLHAVIDSLGFSGSIIENHSVAPFSIHSGAFEILTLTKFVAKNTVNLGVIDPGVGSTRAGIIMKTKNFWFVGPDNGLLYPAANRDGIQKVWKINETNFKNVTNTFHGRDVFIKVAIYLAKNKIPEDFKSTLIDESEIVALNFHNGEVLHIDAYGNLKIYTDKKISQGNTILIRNGNFELKVPVVRTFDDVERGKPLAYEGSSHTLEIAINQGNFAEQYEISNNEIIQIVET